MWYQRGSYADKHASNVAFVALPYARAQWYKRVRNFKNYVIRNWKILTQKLDVWHQIIEHWNFRICVSVRY